MFPATSTRPVVARTYEIDHPLGPIWLRLGLGATVAALPSWTSRAWLVSVAGVVAISGGQAQNFSMLSAIRHLTEGGHGR